MQIVTYNRNQIDRKLCRAIIVLLRSTWPPKGKLEPIDESMNRFLYRDMPSFEKHHIIIDKSKLIGYSQVFSRDIQIQGTIIKNLALSSVCVESSQRKHGHGTLLVKRSFEDVNSGMFECSIFQTSTPHFYERLGAKQIDNTFVNSLNKNRSPWWDDFVMLYPKDYTLPQSSIDLRGSGY